MPRFLSQNYKYVAAIVLVLGLGNPLTVSPGTSSTSYSYWGPPFQILTQNNYLSYCFIIQYFQCSFWKYNKKFQCQSPFNSLPYCVHSYGFSPVYVLMYLAWLPGWINPLSHYVYMWLLPCICSHVFDKINRFIKSLVTLFAYKWFLCVKIPNHSHSLTQHHCKQDQPFYH